MIDVHCHLVFEVDDGSRSLEESLQMVKQFLDSGYTGAIVTPHFDSGRFVVPGEKVKAGVSLLEEALAKEGISFDLYPGNEIQLDLRTPEDLLSGRALTLGGSRYALIEWPMLTCPNYAVDLIYKCNLEGYVAVIAHPERYRYVQNHVDFLLDFLKSGCLIQMNLSSLREEGPTKETAVELLRRNMVHLVGTDTHQSQWRSPSVHRELALLEDLVGEERFQEMTEVRPRRILEDEFLSSKYEEVLPGKEKKRPRKRGFLFKFWK